MRRFIIHLLIKHQQSKSPVSWAVRKVLNYRHLGWGWGEKSGIIKIEAGSRIWIWMAPGILEWYNC